MTAIAAIAKAGLVTMGSDSMTLVGGAAVDSGRSKVIVRQDGMLIGVSGRVRGSEAIEHRLQLWPQAKHVTDEAWIVTTFADAIRDVFKQIGLTRVENNEEGHSTYLLVGYRGRLYNLWDDLSVTTNREPYAATGSGMDIALGSLHATAALDWAPEKRIRSALTAAARFNAYVRPPFRVVAR